MTDTKPDAKEDFVKAIAPSMNSSAGTQPGTHPPYTTSSLADRYFWVQALMTMSQNPSKVFYSILRWRIPTQWRRREVGEAAMLAASRVDNAYSYSMTH